MDPALRRLLEQTGVRRGGEPARTRHGHLGTGFPRLDQSLPGGGWSLGTITEILCDREGIGEIRLVMSALARLSRSERWIVWVSPPHVPYAPALAQQGIALSRVLWVRAGTDREKVWAAEQALSSRACGAALLWLSAADDRSLRRLQIAAEKGGTWGILFRPGRARTRPSPAALRLGLAPAAAGTEVEVLKCRGRAPARPLIVQ